MGAAIMAVLAILSGTTARAGVPEDIVAMIAGEYDNARHRASEANAVSTVPGKHLVKAPPRYLMIRPVRLPNLAGAAAYLEWHDTSKSGPGTTERVWAFTETADGVAMNFYTLLPSGREKLKGVAQGAPGAAERAATVTLDDLFSYHERCAFRFARDGDTYRGELPKGQCVMLQRSKNAYMTVEALVEISPNRLREYTEFDYSRPDMPDEYENRVYDRVK
jgi:hypothetical protein